jgi:hypothetical protein
MFRNGATAVNIAAHTVQKILQLVYRRNLEKFGDAG